MTDFIKTGVIGHPISHSKSPLIHNYWLEKYGLNGAYKAIDIRPNDLKQDIQKLIDQGYTGFNVTIPHKISIMDLCDEIDDLAKEIGAVNTVTIKDGKLYGTNTDAYGFIQNIKSNEPDFDFKAGKAVILGAGGAANAIAYALIKEGVPEIIITNRTKEKAQKLARGIIKVTDWEDRNEAIKNANLVINTTSLGMAGQPALDIELSNNNLVTDIVYAPLHTDLLKQAQSKNIKIVTGIGMLLHQACRGFELWNGVFPSVTNELEQMVLA